MNLKELKLALYSALLNVKDLTDAEINIMYELSKDEDVQSHLSKYSRGIKSLEEMELTEEEAKIIDEAIKSGSAKPKIKVQALPEFLS